MNVEQLALICIGSFFNCMTFAVGFFVGSYGKK